MPSEEFSEDFFQRIKDVSWDTEPECFFAVGDGGLIVNNIAAYGGGNIWTSPDGKHWTKSITNLNESGAAVGGLYCGLWMRQGFRLEGKPVWIMGGQGLDISGGSAQQDTRPIVACSLDGCDHIQQTFFENGSPPHIFIDETYVQPQSLAPVTAIARTFRQRQHYSVDGLTWTDSIGSKGSPSSGGSPPPIPGTGPITTVGGPDPAIKDTNQIWRRSARAAHGKVRKGKLKGRKIQVFGMGGTQEYFTSTVRITDQTTGKSLGTANTGIPFGRGVGYGHYVFVVSGSDTVISGGGGSGGYISWSDDGLTWNRQRMGEHVCWPIVVGPRA